MIKALACRPMGSAMSTSRATHGGSLGGANAGNSDAFISKYDATGTLLWTEQLGTSADDVSRGVSADGLGNVYLSGYTRGSLGGANAGFDDAFVVKFSDSTTIPGTIPGDFDGDGLVGLTDLNILGGNWNQSVTPGTNGDANGNGLVGLEDLLVLGGNWDSPPATSIPEPTSLMLALVALSTGLRRNR